MLVRRSTYNRVKAERDELAKKLEKRESFIEKTKHMVKAYLDISEELKERFSHLDLNSLYDTFPETEGSQDEKEGNLTKLQDKYDGIERLEKKLASIPDGAKGRGGIDVIKDGKEIQLDFKTKKELEAILKDAKKGKIQIVSQAW